MFDLFSKKIYMAPYNIEQEGNHWWLWNAHVCHIIDGRCTTLENFFLNNHLNQSDNLILSGQDADTTGCSLHTQISSLIFTSVILA